MINRLWVPKPTSQRPLSTETLREIEQFETVVAPLLPALTQALAEAFDAAIQD